MQEIYKFLNMNKDVNKLLKDVNLALNLVD